MIFVTVGTHPELGFERLVQAVDEAAAQLEEPVIIQRGCAQYEPRFAEHFRFDSSVRIDQLNQQARLIISHAAAGAIIFALRNRKPLVVVPRRHHLGEHIDDHQLELARALAARNRVITVYEPTATTILQGIRDTSQLDLSGGNAMALVSKLHETVQSWGGQQGAITTSGSSGTSIETGWQ